MHVVNWFYWLLEQSLMILVLHFKKACWWFVRRFETGGILVQNADWLDLNPSFLHFLQHLVYELVGPLWLNDVYWLVHKHLFHVFFLHIRFDEHKIRDAASR